MNQTIINHNSAIRSKLLFQVGSILCVNKDRIKEIVEKIGWTSITANMILHLLTQTKNVVALWYKVC